ncbi:SigE family RNA polymerase sigma factor [Allorhizocola rhizosphaerae]|uniref:SigE family RNA polymerase sigma factor n=1 Tax=Allorhizocola rhizosphaerae TaxID=1872709 RepID=UPI000E3D9491|nr:SigE family RNA polymerase sigma factor [Allorhizocola rhizosphaerae]
MRAEWEPEYIEFIAAAMPRLYRQAYLLTGDRHHADDVTQQACTDLYVHWRRVREARDPEAYSRTVLVKAFLNTKRRAWSSRVQLTGEVPQVAAAEPEYAEHTELRVALQRVPPRQRAVLVLRFLYDLPVAEVAQILGCSAGKVKSQTAHGLTTLRRLLGGEVKLRGSR